MQSYNIDEKREYSDIEIYNAIKLVIKKKDLDAYGKLLLIAEFIKHISNNNLLNSTLQFLKERKQLRHYNEISKYLHPIISNLIYTENDIVRIRAIIYSCLLKHETEMYFNKSIYKDDVPELRFDVKARNIYCNVDNIMKKGSKNKFKFYLDYNKNLPNTERENDYKKMIILMANMDFEYDTNTFKKEIEYLSILKENVPKLNISFNENPHPRIFTTSQAYKIFNHFTEDIKQRTETADYSFIFRQMQKDNLIYESIKNKEYMDWLSKEFNINIDMVKTMDNCSTPYKIKHYNTLKHQNKQ